MRRVLGQKRGSKHTQSTQLLQYSCPRGVPHGKPCTSHQGRFSREATEVQKWRCSPNKYVPLLLQTPGRSITARKLQELE